MNPIKDKREIITLLDERDKFLAEDNDEICDIIEDDITQHLKNNFNEYPVDFIIETLTRFGQDVSMVYDDNGHFAIPTIGMGSININDNELLPSTDITHIFDDKNAWKETIREALKYYLFDEHIKYEKNEI